MIPISDRSSGWLSAGGFAVTVAAVLVGPWLFGAWEVWWFWPLALLLFLMTIGLSAEMLLNRARPDASKPGEKTAFPLLLFSAGAVFAVFLIYLGIRTFQADVRHDAVRTLLLFLLPALVGLRVVCGISPTQKDRLTHLLIANFLLLGLYGIVNHFVTGSQWVLWREGYEQYWKDHRASGSYFCPDHYAGIMELAAAAGLGLALARRNIWRLRLLGALLTAVAVVGVVMSRSRGGGIALAAMAVGVLIFGFYQYSPLKRWSMRVSLTAVLAMLVVLAWQSSHPYTVRFKSYFGAGKTVPSWAEIKQRIEPDCRWQMPAAALRAWREHPWFGVGPGMHQNLWLHYAATPDGDRDLNAWPSRLNNGYHSYEVHSDWIQLLEETGLAGFGLFLTGVVLLAIWYLKRLAVIGRRQRRRRWSRRERLDPDPYSAPLTALLAMTAMATHSLGDFNLQMPATGWVLATMMAVPLFGNALLTALRRPMSDTSRNTCGDDIETAVPGR